MLCEKEDVTMSEDTQKVSTPVESSGEALFTIFTSSKVFLKWHPVLSFGFCLNRTATNFKLILNQLKRKTFNCTSSKAYQRLVTILTLSNYTDDKSANKVSTSETIFLVELERYADFYTKRENPNIVF